MSTGEELWIFSQEDVQKNPHQCRFSVMKTLKIRLKDLKDIIFYLKGLSTGYKQFSPEFLKKKEALKQA